MQQAQVPGVPDGTPMGEGISPGTLTQSDAAAICAGMRDKFYLAGRVAWGRCEASTDRLTRFLWIEAAGLAHREGWVVCIGREVLRRLSELAVRELLDPARYNSEPARVAFFGKHIEVGQDRVWTLWERTWRKRYQAIYQILERWVDVSGSHVAHRQRDEEEVG